MSILAHSQVLAAVTMVTTAETAIVVSPLASMGGPSLGQKVIIRGHVNVAVGAGTTAVTVRVREGSGVGGALIGNAEIHTIAAGANANIPFSWEDNVSPQFAALGGGGAYTVTVQQTAATANGFAWGDIAVEVSP